VLGGGQEMGRRAGTENIIGIAGFGAAAEASARDLSAGKWATIEKLRNILEKTLEASGKPLILVGTDSPRLPNTACFAAPGWKGETQVMQMDLAGFAVSAGSACSSGKVKASRVLRAMGYDEDVASSAIRVSLGLETTEDEVQQFAKVWLAAYERFLARKAAR
ncbi:aminotransferase class V-fold PLP-dependent enzyme, partial [Planktomarina temperata]|nr:aminotransferase class V-fold PLP-dependent enzyme [Planktomarina temperata]